MISSPTPVGLRYALLVSDFDGTLCDANWLVAPEVRAELYAYRQAGGVVCIATGRPYYGILSTFMQENELTTPAVVHGGAKVVDPVTGLAIWGKPIEWSAMKQLFDSLVAMDEILNFTIEQEDRVAMDPTWVRQVFGEGVVAVSRDRWEEQPVYKCVVRLRDIKNVLLFQKVEETLKKIPDLQIYPSVGKGGPILDITAIGANKQQACIHLLEHLGYSTDQVMFAGDGGNDIPLLQVGGWKASASYAPEALRKSADVVIENDDHQMVARLLEEYAYLD